MARALSERRAFTGIRTHIRQNLFALVIVGVVAGCGDSLVDPKLAPPQQLLFVSGPFTPSANVHQAWFDLKKDIYRMNADGTGLENVTGLPSHVYGSLSLSNDGRKIAFYSNRSGCFSIWTMNVDGTGLRDLTAGNFFEVRCNYTPRWSPDDSRIAFETSREGRFSVYVMNADGSNPRNVSAPLDRVPSGHVWPHGWTPDGRVVFQHSAPGATVQAYIVNPDGTGLVPFGQTGDHSPEWSPDGSKVAFIRNVGGRESLFVMSSDGSNVRQLTSQGGDDAMMYFFRQDNDYDYWSPDGSRIAFMNTVDFKDAIEVIGVDGSGHRRLTGHGTMTAFNGWSNDGRITFTSDAAGTMDIYVIKPDGSGLVNLTGSATHDGYALWVPR